ncbi:Pycsar system effector family protein [Nonomuraea endophytica]|uniref:Pycsar system effector family protein n=1 Tax=Nonomuraea endophytica TaxID=714136 RepID=UPI0037C71073
MSDVSGGKSSAAPPSVEYARRMYDRVIDWYKVAEAKAQLILTINGVVATIIFGLLSGRLSELRNASPVIGPETWVFLGVSLGALCGSIGFATACLHSRHNYNIRTDFAQLGIVADNQATYRPEGLWYFGHLATLRWQWVAEALRAADDDAEILTLTYNVHGLAKVVLRKHRLINTGWTLTSLGLIALIAAAASLIVRSQLN